MDQFRGIKLFLHDTCSVCQSAAPCEAHDPHNPRLIYLKEKLRIANAWIRTEATGQGTDDGTEQNILRLELAAEFFGRFEVSGQQARANYSDSVSELFRQLVLISLNFSFCASWLKKAKLPGKFFQTFK